MDTRETLETLARFESRNVTFRDPSGDWPIVWERAKDCHVWTPEGRRYLDLTAAFGVAAAGHANPRVVAAGRRQLGRLTHAMGDVHPHPLKAALARELVQLTFGRWTPSAGEGRVLFCNSGSEAVEAALKTARLASGRPGVLAFDGAYHGLGYGALNVTHREHFRGPFRNQLAEFGRFVAFPTDADQGRKSLDAAHAALAGGGLGAVLVEPAQARGGIRFPPPGFLSALRALAARHGALFILDEVYTGFGRTGRWFAAEHEGVVPDLICLGKALAGGFPIAACVGSAAVMDAWPPSQGEAVHTSTFLGHPVGCAMALAEIDELRRRRLPERAERTGAVLDAALRSLPASLGGHRLAVRCRGLMAGVEITSPDGAPAGAESFAVVRRMLDLGFVALPEGAAGEVIGLTPPLTIPQAAVRRAVAALRTALETVLVGAPAHRPTAA